MAVPQMSILPFNPEMLSFDHMSTTWIEVDVESKLYHLVAAHVAGNLVTEETSNSFAVEIIPASSSKKTADSLQPTRTKVNIGLGLFSFIDTQGRRLRALHQSIGEPVGTNCGVQWLRSIVVFYPEVGHQKSLVAFCDDLVRASEATEAGYYSIFTWHIRHQYWREQSSCKARVVDSVILSSKVKDRLFSDVDRFLDPKTASFYDHHGIPYRRSYLFHGVPGAGKTSLVQALAGRIKRNLYFVQPTDPDMTDDSLRAAISQVADNAIVVIEDIDALFTKDRKKKVEKSPLTFSGLLNALDGIGSAVGQLFILTTNLREELDPALIRNGRVDLHIHFDYADEEQMRGMWTSYYPHAEDKADTFVSSLKETLGIRPVVMASIQHFFIQQMHKTAEEALSDVGSILEEIKQRETVQPAEGPSEEVSTKDSNMTDEESNEVKESDDGDAAAGQMHVHVHLHSDTKKANKKSAK